MRKVKFWWDLKRNADLYIPIFSDSWLPITSRHSFPDIFGKTFDIDNWLAAREQLWAIREGLA